ncbi:MAG TPA: class I SAM-dependent methyltransferase [Baekduia sp.]|uniref:class I SAM-dependent methyltransferase n=1 Tax=Baekduia sp. TaxID=2600305 RepID=UPI002B8FDB69|nr:class I SAM-dependent methyltransferase [Baekduia sp.]HMJ32356.1 class I SAM-dependent methyltransferase [Baekduia sp.]
MTHDELQAMLASDERHWWYRGRRRVLRAELDRLPLAPDPRLLDAGCGSGRTLDELARYGRVSGIDLSPEAVAAAHRRGHRDVRVGHVERLPFPDATFDVVTCLDVVEHTPDDRATLAELRRVARPGGLLLVTVPAYQALWSWHDEVNLHYRRYDSSSLRAAARAAGWDVVGDTHFNSLLLGPAAAVRVAQRRRRRHTHSDLDLTPLRLNGVLELPLRLEARLLASGTRLPAGLSLLAVLRRPALREPRRAEADLWRADGPRHHRLRRRSSVTSSIADGSVRATSTVP